MEKLCVLIMLVCCAATFPLRQEKQKVVEPLVIELPCVEVPKEVKKPKLLLTIKGLNIEKFKKVIGRRESKNNYKARSISGCMGKYQFLASTLRTLDINVTDSAFLADSLLQEVAMTKLVVNNHKWLERQGLLRHVGDTVGGVKITQYGMLAAMHLLGGASLQDYLDTGGSMEEYVKVTKTGKKVRIRKRDGLNTTIKDYLMLF